MGISFKVATMAIDLKESTETLPPSDRRDQAVKEIDAMCRDLIETVHKLERISKEPNSERMIGRLEERIFTATDAIHKKQRDLYLDEGIMISISHTLDGLPIRVNKARRMMIWEG